MIPLLGRRHERRALDQNLTDADTGRGGSIVLVGEPGAGKTALLSATATVAAARGFEVTTLQCAASDAHRPYGSLTLLTADVTAELGTMPPAHATALAAALGLQRAADDGPDRLHVALGLLEVLSCRARTGPVLWVVDDAHHLDALSAEVLALVARRMSTVRALLLLAHDGAEGLPVLEDLPSLAVGAFDAADGRALLRRHAPALVDDVVATRIVAECDALPGAITAVARALVDPDATGGLAPPTADADRVEDVHRRRYLALSTSARRLLVLAALDQTGDLDLLERAAPRLGIRRREFRVVDDAGLLRLDPPVTFSDPFLRAFVVSSVTSEELRRCHGALSKATTRRADPARRAWHRARAATRPSEGLARELERRGPGAASRGGLAAQASLLAAAVEPSPAAESRARRALGAAEVALRAGARPRARELTHLAERTGRDRPGAWPARRLRALTDPALDGRAELQRELLELARSLAAIDPAQAGGLFLEALEVAVAAPRAATEPVAEIAGAGYRSARGSNLDPAGFALLRWFAIEPGERRTDDAERCAHDLSVAPPGTRWAWLGAQALTETGRDEAASVLVGRAIDQRRADGELWDLPRLLDLGAAFALDAGELDRAMAMLEDADRVSDVGGLARAQSTAALLDAWQGRRPPAVARAGGGRPGSFDDLAAALSANAAQESAGSSSRWPSDVAEPRGLASRLLGEWVEATIRGEDRACADAALEVSARRVHAGGGDRALGIHARNAALTVARRGDDATAAFDSAIEQLGLTASLLELGRTHLYYGEWLDSVEPESGRHHLGTAQDIFASTGATLFVHRLDPRGSNEDSTEAPLEEASPWSELTDQEARVAQLVIDGRSNPQIATELAISRRTVEYHLHKVFAKVGVSNRHMLRARFENRRSAAS